MTQATSYGVSMQPHYALIADWWTLHMRSRILTPHWHNKCPHFRVNMEFCIFYCFRESCCTFQKYNKSSISINPTMNDKLPANEFVESIYGAEVRLTWEHHLRNCSEKPANGEECWLDQCNEWCLFRDVKGDVKLKFTSFSCRDAQRVADPCPGKLPASTIIYLS